MVILSNLTSLTLVFLPNTSQCPWIYFPLSDVSAAAASLLVRPFQSNQYVHLYVVCLWFPLFQKEASPPPNPFPDLAPVPPRLCSGDQPPHSNFLNTDRYISLAVFCMFSSCVSNKSRSSLQALFFSSSTLY